MYGILDFVKKRKNNSHPNSNARCFILEDICLVDISYVKNIFVGSQNPNFSRSAPDNLKYMYINNAET